MNKNKVLILTKYNDTHARVVGCCLEQLGIEFFRWFGSNFPIHEQMCLSLSDAGNYLIIDGGNEGSVILNDFNVVWFRRPSLPSLPSGLDPRDADIIDRENVAFMKNALSFLSSDRFWVNDYQSQFIANNKFIQLIAARKVGFSVPSTIMGNSPCMIDRFAKSLEFPDIVFKTFTPVVWNEGDRHSMLYATRVSLDSIDDSRIRNAAAIWQEPIEKDFELRITVIGKTIFAARINSQSNALARDDWRAGRGMYKMEYFEVCDHLKNKCISLMCELGLVFGCIDVIITPSGDHVFLEVNEAGQFLWIEERLPVIPMLDAFVKFLAEPSPSFVYDFNRKFHLSDVYASSAYKKMDALDKSSWEQKSIIG